ncbi:MAG: hypothetical protein Q8916_10545 [Bacteroidota bacterium]|nr:hypothetical protein [Bacteroidota bacterium]MDP4230827.1 hypothetical protein [Bacteroidota bacterium]
MIWTQFAWLLILSLPIACISWTVTHEEVFHELHEYFVKRVEHGRNIFTRKFFYMLTCEYCFSHYVTILFLWISGFTMLYDGWRGYVIAGFSLVWIANVYMSLYSRIRIGIKTETLESKLEEKELNEHSKGK